MKENELVAAHCLFCNIVFQPKRPWQKYCSKKCRTMHWALTYTTLPTAELDALRLAASQQSCSESKQDEPLAPCNPSGLPAASQSGTQTPLSLSAQPSLTASNSPTGLSCNPTGLQPSAATQPAKQTTQPRAKRTSAKRVNKQKKGS